MVFTKFILLIYIVSMTVFSLIKLAFSLSPRKKEKNIDMVITKPFKSRLQTVQQNFVWNYGRQMIIVGLPDLANGRSFKSFLGRKQPFSLEAL